MVSATCDRRCESFSSIAATPLAPLEVPLLPVAPICSDMSFRFFFCVKEINEEFTKALKQHCNPRRGKNADITWLQSRVSFSFESLYLFLLP
jgi:hypothetical protein